MFSWGRFLCLQVTGKILTREIVAANLHEAGWSLGWVSALNLEWRTIRIVDAHGGGKRFTVRANEILAAFLELEAANRARDELS
jgi:hypothetical protein